MKIRRNADNYRRLVVYQVFNAAAIAIGANWVVTDMILLRMEFDLSLFGLIKSSMFLMPALSYWAAAGLLRRWNCDRRVCLFSYLARAVLPLALPAAAMLTRDRDVLMIVALIVFSGGYTFAMFANNSLLALYRQALPREKFNCGGSLLTALPGPVAALVAIPTVWLLGRAGESAFFPLLFLLQALTLLAEIPAAAAILGVKVHETPRPEPFSLREWTLPFRDPEFRPLFGFVLLHMLWIGLVSTYLVVYLLKIRRFPAELIVLLECGLSVAVAAGARSAGRLADRFGSLPVLAAGSAATLLVCGGWTLFPACVPLFLVYLFFVYNGNSGFLSSSMRNLESCASASHASPGNANHYVAALALGQSLGCFAGCLLAGPLFAALPGEGADRFRLYFVAAALPAVAMTLFAFQQCTIKRRKTYVQQANRCRP